MWNCAHIIVVIILCIQYECMSTPSGKERQNEKIYAYRAHLDTRSNAEENILARWSVSANLTVQRINNYQAFQLKNIKVNLFNGLTENLDQSHEQDIPPEASSLFQPFVLYDDSIISVAEDEPLWSLNLKKSIANYFVIRSGKNIEKLIFGKCEVFYETIDKNNVKKTVNHNKCLENRCKHITNVRPAPASNNFKPIQIQTKIMTNQNGDIQAWSNLTYKLMSKLQYTQNVDQYQEFKLLSSSTDYDKINISNLNVERDLIYDCGSKYFPSRHKIQTDTKVLINQFLENFKIFEEKFKQIPIVQTFDNDPIEKMIISMYSLPDKKGFEQLRDKVEEKVDWELISSFYTLLPYIGTNQSVDFINDILIDPMTNFGTPFYANRMLAIFPEYIDDPNEELIKNLEKLLNSKVTERDLYESSRILSFSSVIRKAIKENSLSYKVLNKYKGLFHKRFLESKNKDTRMVYLLGLVNMADALSSDFIISIITNTTETNFFRSLALTGFRSKLSTEPNKIFNTIWSIVQNTNENFEIRVKALDLLLSSNLTEEQYHKILETCKKYISGDARSMHLANYFISTLESIQNITQYKDPLGKFAGITLENEDFSTLLPMTTGNYRVSFTDSEPNFGGYLQARLISNPHFTSINSAEISLNQFAMSFDMGTYSIYINFPGLIEAINMHSFMKSFTSSTSVKELLNIIKEHSFKIKSFSFELKYEIDIIFFVDGRAIYALTVSDDNVNEKGSQIERIVGDIFHHFTISYPLWDYVHIPSMLGSPLIILNEIQDITTFGKNTSFLNYRSSNIYRTCLRAYNPLLDTSITSSKYYGNDKNIFTSIALGNKIEWTITNNPFTWKQDNFLGTSITNKDILQKFCPKCNAVTEIRSKKPHSTKSYSMSEVKLSYTGTDEIDFSPIHILNTHQSNANSGLYLQPLLLWWHYFFDSYYVNSEISSKAYQVAPLSEEPIRFILTIDYLKQPLKELTDPFNNQHLNISAILTVEYYTLKTLSETGILLQYQSTVDNENERVQFQQNVYMYHQLGKNKINKICFSRNYVLPKINHDLLAWKMSENITIRSTFSQDKSNKKLFAKCVTGDHILTATEKFYVRDTNKFKAFEQCKTASTGLKFTPPVPSCITSYFLGSQYQAYQLYINPKKLIKIYPGFKKHPVISMSRNKYNKLKYSLLKHPSFDRNSYWSSTVISRSPMFNPVFDVNQDYDIIVGYKEYCTITPNEIRSFTGLYFPYKGNESIAFIECLEESSRGMTTHRISDTQIGFKLWMTNTKIEATVKSDKLILSLNSKIIDYTIGLVEFENNQNIKIRFLEENVVFINDNELNVYYNTEYIAIKIKSLYKSIISGDCKQE